ncbi:response regulator [Geobacter sp. DSM 9736]|uniref:response regulator n=1 Tax=Geobacter sp. DSM 9736 TaxID=1277350 RepID=UPI000B50EB9C|nr:response regulator [Geobacter sp. DSM 9736]SNB45139.1 two-component system, chemotaxis family, response regulator CheY [Geobacter sp. DSM 9736]
MAEYRCLVADDDELGRELIAQYLDGLAVCTMAENGRQAVDSFVAAKAKGEPFDLAILDIVMPEIDGHAAGKEIRRIERLEGVPVSQQVKIIILSSRNAPQDIMESFMSAQSAAHLVKPVEPAKLRETLGKLGIRKRA